MAKNLVKQLAKHNLRGQQARWTAEEAMAWAWERHKAVGQWPAFRFRVEGGPAGNSRLLTKKAAERAHAANHFKGAIVELIPTATEAGVPRATNHNFNAAGLGVCPKCQAAPDVGCRTPTGVACAPHDVRTKPRKVTPIDVPCPFAHCGAAAGAPCQNKKGVALTKLHSARVAAVKA